MRIPSNAKVIGATLVALTFAHLVLYRAILGVPRLDPHDPAEERWFPLLLSSVVVLAAAGLACRLYSSRLAAFGGALLAAVTTESYFVAVDWLEVGSGNEVGHDIWLGDEGYWSLSIIRVLIFGIAFAIVVGASWGVRRDVRAQAAAEPAVAADDAAHRR
jgi:hypothetical protein